MNKYFQYAEKMIPLFFAILKFCSTKHLYFQQENTPLSFYAIYALPERLVYSISNILLMYLAENSKETLSNNG